MAGISVTGQEEVMRDFAMASAEVRRAVEIESLDEGEMPSTAMRRAR